MDKNTKERYLNQKTDYYYGLLSTDIEKSLTADQKDEIKKLIKRMVPVPAKKLVDVRFTFWFIKRIFAVVFIGVSKRKNERKSDLKGLHRFLSLEFKLIFYLLEAALVLFALISLLFIIKVLFGVNMMSYFY